MQNLPVPLSEAYCYTP